MKHIITYYTQHGKLCHVWTMATSKPDAIRQAEREYWDIKEIIQVRTA